MVPPHLLLRNCCRSSWERIGYNILFKLSHAGLLKGPLPPLAPLPPEKVPKWAPSEARGP